MFAGVPLPQRLVLAGKRHEIAKILGEARERTETVGDGAPGR